MLLFRKIRKASKSTLQSSDATSTSGTPTPSPGELASSPASSSDVVPPEAADSNSQDYDGSLKKAAEEIMHATTELKKEEESKFRKKLKRAGGTADTFQKVVETVGSGIEELKPAYESNELQPFREGVLKIADGLPTLVKVLEEVAKMHPFISVAVGAFRVVVELETKRRENDEKIALLLVQMRDMMAALVQLRDIQDEDEHDGETIKDRLQDVVERTAKDIKKCANVCDTYVKKKLVVKVILASVWNGKLEDYILRFKEYRKQFSFQLSVHVGVGIDDAKRKLRDIDAKIDTVLSFFKMVMSPEQRELAALVEKKGGREVVMGNNDMLKEVLKFRPAVTIDPAKRGSGRDGAAEHNVGHQEGDESDLAVVKEELLDSPELAIKKNLQAFERKFDLQQQELNNLGGIVRHEGDRLFKAVTGGPHERITDQDIHDIWKEMHWRAHVKARHFVLALRDHYLQHVKRKRETPHTDDVKSRVADGDEWALEWININRLQAIIEAFDDDASGFITVAEVNEFTTTPSRPAEWSLPHWLAYWAIGWQMTATKYRDMITNISAKMFAIRTDIHPANRNAVDEYLQKVWQPISTLTCSFLRTSQPESLLERFRSYIDAEEQRLRKNLETVKYDIDDRDTLLLVIGPGRIEKYLFPLLWLLLKRDFEIFRICRHTVIHQDELWDSADTIGWVFKAVQERHDNLEVFANELYDYWHFSERMWSLDNLRKLHFAEVEYDDLKEDQNVDASKVLNYRTAADELYPPQIKDSAAPYDAAADRAVGLILGRWNGVLISEDGATSPMITFCLHASEDHKTFEASSVGANGTGYNILDDYMPQDNDTVQYSFVQAYVARLKRTYWTGTLEDDGQTLSGKWGYAKDDQPWTFVFKRIPPEVLVNRPLADEFAENRVKALWKYALTAVLDQVRRRLCSWSYLAERRDNRKEYLELLRRETSDGLQTNEGSEGFSVLARRLTFDDARCFYILNDNGRRAVTPHFGISCDSCGDLIYGTRVVCMDCGWRSTFDFCDKLECVNGTIPSRNDIDIASPHLPTHDFVKLRAPILQEREIGKILRNATAGLGRAKVLLEEAEYQKRYHGFVTDYEEEHARDGDNDGDDGEDTEDSQGAMRRSSLTAVLVLHRLPRVAWLRGTHAEDSKPFICWDCDAQPEEAGFEHGEHHIATHILVRCMEPQMAEVQLQEPEEDPMEKRLGALEGKLDGLMGQFQMLLTSLAVARAE
ncbi:hypothetical protein V8D89_015985 [Ganoderma adspersum]